MKFLNNFVIFLFILLFQSCTYNEQTDEFETTWVFWYFILAAVFSVIAASIWQSKYKDKQLKISEERRNMYSNESKKFHISAKVAGVNDIFQFIVDDVANNIIFIEYNANKEIIPFDNIISVDIEEDNSIIYSKSIGRTIGGALIGDIVAGGAGMIVGGLSGNSQQKKKVSKVEVVIKLRDINKTALHIVCFDALRETNNSNKEIKTDDFVFGELYDKGMEDAIKIADLINIIIDKMNNEKEQKNKLKPTFSVSSIADELTKLAELKKQGIISEEEFTNIKSKLIK